MNILLATQNFPPTHGGIAVFLYNLCRQLARRRHEVHVLVLTSLQREEHAKMRAGNRFWVHPVSLPHRMSSLFIVRYLLKVVRQQRPDIIFMGHEVCSEAVAIWVVRKLLGVPIVMLIHGAMLQWFLHQLKGINNIWARLGLREASLILANSAFTERTLIQEGVGKEKTAILHPGVDIKQFRPGVDISDVVRRYQLWGKRVLLSVGRLTKRKNFAAVLEAMAAVLPHFPEVVYIVVGEGPEEEALKEEARALGLNQSVIFAGAVDNDQLPAYYCAAELFIMPSLGLEGDKETFGIVYLEANACRVPVVGARTGGIEDAVINGETGLLVDPQRTADIVAAIIRLLGDREYAQQLGTNGRLRVEREFSWDKVGERLEGYLESVIRRERDGCTSPS